MRYYCNNGEDRTLDELLEFKQQGFYIDVGAHSANHESVTKTFYERGWSGINVEPQPRYYHELTQFRPRDVNLNIACGSEPGMLKLWEGDGLTTAIKQFAHTDWKQFEIPMMRLDTVCMVHAPKDGIDFLKIDVEGYEQQVLQGMNFNKFRPKLLCIEATIPMSETPNFEIWEPIVLQADYNLVKRDRVNRYYQDVR